MANARGIIHDLSRDEKKAEELLQEISNQDLVKVILESLEEYNRPWRRLVVSRANEIKEKLRSVGFDENSTAANPMNLKSTKEIFDVMKEGGGENDNSFKTIFIQHLLQTFTEHVIDKRLKEKEEIVKQKSALLLLQEKRLKEEEDLVILQLDKINCMNALSVLKSQTSQLDGRKAELESDLEDLRESIAQSSKEEEEKRAKLEETKRYLEEESIKFSDIVAKHKAVHIDFACEDFTLEQLEKCRESARQGWCQTAAVINGKLKLQNELNDIKTKRTVITLDESQCNKKLEEMQKARKEDVDSLIKARGVTPERLLEIKEHLMSKLRGIRKEQEMIRDLSLEVSGFHATTNNNHALEIQDNYTGEPAPAVERKLEVKPVAKSFKNMKVRQGMRSNNEATNEAFKNLSFFFSKAAMPVKEIEEQVTAVPNPTP